MRGEVMLLAVIVGACTWALRYVPLRMDLSNLRPDSLLGRFLAATGPAAIGTLFVAEVLPYLGRPLTDQIPLYVGVLAVIAVYAGARSPVLATLAGAVAFGVATALGG